MSPPNRPLSNRPLSNRQTPIRLHDPVPGTTRRWCRPGRCSPRPARPVVAGRRRITERTEALATLDAARRPLFAEMARLAADPTYRPAGPPDRCCRRPRNQMRLSTLEALAIARAFRNRPELAAQRPAIARRVRRAAAELVDCEDQQSYDCPLLADGLCLVHRHAKPLACLAWNEGIGISTIGLRALALRDLLNRRVVGPRWALKAIPLLLARALTPSRAVGRTGPT